MRRVHPAYLAAVAVLVLGALGLLRGLGSGSGDPAAGGFPLPAAGPTTPPGVTAGDLTISGAYVYPPAPPTPSAAGYLTITNNGRQADILRQVTSGAADAVALMDLPGVTPSDGPGQAGGEHRTSGPLTIPAGGTVVIAPGRGHIMLDKLTGPLRPGDRVSLLLTFEHAGVVLVEAPVVPIGAPAPTGGNR